MQDHERVCSEARTASLPPAPSWVERSHRARHLSGFSERVEVNVDASRCVPFKFPGACVPKSGADQGAHETGGTPHLERTVTAARRELTAAGVTELPSVVVADSGYWHTKQIQRLTGDGIPVLIRSESGLRTTPRPGWRGGIYDFMRRVLATEHGQALYRQRQHIIESVFGNTKHNRGITRFHRRGRAAVRTEWRLCMATHNLLKLHNHQLVGQAA